MPLTPNISLSAPNHGDWPNTWEQPVNQNWGIIDALFSGSVPTGHAHTGVAGSGPKIDHTDLLVIGVKTHAELDAAFAQGKVSSGDTTPNYFESKIVAGANIVITKLNAGANEQLEISAGAGGSAWVVGDEYGGKHTVPTSAPVAYTDNFTYPNGFVLRQADYAVQRTSGGGGTLLDFFTTGFSAALFVDPSAGDDPVGKYSATVSSQIPHGPAQRVTCSITDINYGDLVVGDYAAFTMSLFSTHRQGTFFPQKHGVLLEVRLVKIGTGPDVFQMSHSIFVLPTASTKVLLYQHNHTDPEDMKGVWELSLDSNGHIYHYWRRKLVFSTQTSPVSMPGPAQAYFAALTASLLADNDEKYGAMGFGFHHGISPLSKFNFEFRWLTVTAGSDIYDEIPTCPGTADPYGVVGIDEVPLAFFISAQGVPGVECCPAPNQVNVGDVLTYDPVTGNPAVWVTQCCSLITDSQLSGIVEHGYQVNTSPLCLPCPSPTLNPGGIIIFDLTGDWPEAGPTEGTIGKIVVHGVDNLSPLLGVTSTNPYFVIIDVVWLSYNEFEVKYEIIDGGALIDPVIDLVIFNAVDPTRTLSIPTFATIQVGEPTIESVTWIDTYTYTLTLPTAGYRFEAVLTGKSFTGMTLTSPTSGITIHSFNVDSPSQITADIEIDFAARGLPFVLSAAVGGSGPGDLTLIAGHPYPVGTYLTLNPFPDGPAIDVGRTVVIHGNFFTSGVLVEPVDSSQVRNWNAAYVSQYEISVSFDIIATGVDPLLQVLIENVDSGLSITMPICVIGDVTALSNIGASVVTTPASIYCAGSKPAASGYPPFIYDALNLSGMNASAYTLLTGPTPDEVWKSDGGSHTTGRTVTGIKGQFVNVCGDLGSVNVNVMKPGVGSVTFVGAFSMADPVPATPSGTPSFSTPPVPGASGTVDFLFSAYTYLTDISSVNVSGITFENRSDIGTGLRYDFVIGSDVSPTASVVVSFVDGPCDPGPEPTHTFTTEYLNPVIDSVQGVFYEDVQNYPCIIKGSNFQAGTTILVGGNATYVSHSDVDDETIELVLNLGSAGGATVQVQNNPDGKTSNIFAITVMAEEAPVINHTDMSPSITGVNATLYIYGDNLKPPGAVLAFTGFTAIGAPAYHNDSYIEQYGLITAGVGVDVLLDITSTSHSYLGLFLSTATASPGGAVVITSVDPQLPKDNQDGFQLYIYGQNLDQVDTIEAVAKDQDRLSLAYTPVGPTPAVVVSILSKTTEHILCSVNIEKGVAYNAFNFILYDIAPAFLVLIPSAITAQPSNDAPDIPEGVRTLLDTTIPPDVSTSWSVVIPMAHVYGDQIVDGAGWTLDSPAVYNDILSQWEIAGTNVAGVGVNWELIVSRPSIPLPFGPEQSVYRIPGGVTV